MTTFTREDYEMAAKAAGLKIEFLEPSGRSFLKNGGAWNPRDLDDDSFRLAIAIGAKIGYERNAPPALGLPRECGFAVVDGRWFAVVNRDKATAVRYAIFRAAIAIGRAMP